MGATRLPDLAPYRDYGNATRAHNIVTESTRAAARVTPKVEAWSKGVSVIVSHVDGPDRIVSALDHLRSERNAAEAAGFRLEILVGLSSTPDAALLGYCQQHASELTVITGAGEHVACCQNRLAFAYAECDALLFLSSDIVFTAGTVPVLEMRRALFENPRTGIAGAWLEYPDGTLQHGGIDFFRAPDMRGFPFHPHVRETIFSAQVLPRMRVPSVTGACLMIRTPLYHRIGGMDEGYAKECQDVALCLAADRLGYETELLYLGKIVHFENGTRPRGEESWPDRRRFLRKWSSYVEARFL